MARTFWVFLLIGIAAGGCAARYVPEAQRKAEEAKNIMPADYKSDLLAFMRSYLNNPDNVRNAALSEPQKLMVDSIERYVACVRFNAKDSAGRYLGLRDHLAVFISGKFDRLIELGRVAREASEGNEQHRPLREFCAAATYQPFPELEQLRR
jgi:hypothetical protein